MLIDMCLIYLLRGLLGGARPCLPSVVQHGFSLYSLLQLAMLMHVEIQRHVLQDSFRLQLRIRVIQHLFWPCIPMLFIPMLTAFCLRWEPSQAISPICGLRMAAVWHRCTVRSIFLGVLLHRRLDLQGMHAFLYVTRWCRHS